MWHRLFVEVFKNSKCQSPIIHMLIYYSQEKSVTQRSHNIWLYSMGLSGKIIWIDLFVEVSETPNIITYILLYYSHESHTWQRSPEMVESLERRSKTICIGWLKNKKSKSLAAFTFIIGTKTRTETGARIPDRDPTSDGSTSRVKESNNQMVWFSEVRL